MERKAKLQFSLMAVGVACVLAAPLLMAFQSLGLKEEGPAASSPHVAACLKRTARYEREMDFFSGRRTELFRMSAVLRSGGDQAFANDYLRLGATVYGMPFSALLLAVVNREGYGLKPNRAHAVFWAEKSCELARRNGDRNVEREALAVLSSLARGRE
jgi:hypothetical protein